MVFKFTAKRDKLFVPLVALSVTDRARARCCMGVLVARWVDHPVGSCWSLLAVLIVLNLRANRAMMTEVEGQPGAAAPIVENMRGDCRVTPGGRLDHRRWTSSTWSIGRARRHAGRRGQPAGCAD